MAITTPTKGKRTKNKQASMNDFNAIRLSIASPEKILQWSYGEVLKPETINYRTQKPERDGLFDERIFGPTKDWECYCGKYKKIRYRGVICDKCGVEVTRSSVRRERMGHIELAAPATHIWFVRGMPSTLSAILDISVSNLEKIIYFAGFIVLDVDDELRTDLLEQLEQEYKEFQAKKDVSEEEVAQIEKLYKQTKSELNSLMPGIMLSESKYQQISLQYGNVVRVGIGAEAILEILKKLDLEATIKVLVEEIETASASNKKKLIKRLRILKDLHTAGIKPEWMVLSRIPVIPSDLRPMVQLDGGRFAASDLNDLYRRVINRNNRLKKLLHRGAPEVICRNEKRMLQESVDALIDNSARQGRAVSTGATQRRLRSLSDMLRGKQGRFRQNLLGKRVDYSGRSVIVAGANLKLNECGLPKVMALELFKPFVVGRLLADGHVHNAKNASRMIENGEAIVWDILEEVVAEKYVMLNRAPTLHRLGIQAFKPVLIEGKAIRLHPLVCSAFNADFDGDQMAVHVPLSDSAQKEAREIIQSAKNLLSPSSGESVVTPRLDMVFGAYFITSTQEGVRGEGKVFASKNEAILAYQVGALHPRALIKVRMPNPQTEKTELIETTIGRILFNIAIPKELRFINEPMDAKAFKVLVRKCFNLLGQEATSEMVDNIKDLGYEHATLSGMSIAADDIYIPKSKDKVVGEATEKVKKLHSLYTQGLITDSERRFQSIAVWNKTIAELSQDMIQGFDKNSPVYIATSSGARGSLTQLNQMASMKGLVVSTSGEIIETPIISNFKEGFSELEYFTSTHGTRKTVSDTALKTADAGYLTRRLVDVSQDMIIAAEDCSAEKGITVTREDSDNLGINFGARLIGRTALKDIKDGKKTIVKSGEEIGEDAILAIDSSSIDAVEVRSPINCESSWGICKKCYGRDLATGKLVETGAVVGTVAAQAIGEPGTQLTLRTFHQGGVAGGDDITSGLPRVDELFEARNPKSPAVVTDIEGEVRVKDRKDGRLVEVFSSNERVESFELEEGYEPNIKNGEIVDVKQVLAVATDKKAIRAAFAGRISLRGNKITLTAVEPSKREYMLNPSQVLKVKTGDMVTKGQALTEGHLDLAQNLDYRGLEDTQRYIVSEIQAIYSSQGQDINDKHIETILRQMFSKVRIIDQGDSDWLEDQVVDFTKVIKQNKALAKKDKKEAKYLPTVFGISKIALKTESFLSAASFQETTHVLINAAIRGAKDELVGLKENVIIGRLIPAGTAFRRIKK